MTDIDRSLTDDEAGALDLWLQYLMSEDKPRMQRLAITSAMYVAAVDAGDRHPNERVAHLQSLEGVADPSNLVQQP